MGSSQPVGDEAKCLLCSEFHIRITFSYSHLHDMTNSNTEIFQARVQLPEQETLPWQYVQVWENGYTHYIFNQHWANLVSFSWRMLTNKQTNNISWLGKRKGVPIPLKLFVDTRSITVENVKTFTLTFWAQFKCTHSLLLADLRFSSVSSLGWCWSLSSIDESLCRCWSSLSCCCACNGTILTVHLQSLVLSSIFKPDHVYLFSWFTFRHRLSSASLLQTWRECQFSWLSFSRYFKPEDNNRLFGLIELTRRERRANTEQTHLHTSDTKSDFSEWLSVSSPQEKRHPVSPPAADGIFPCEMRSPCSACPRRRTSQGCYWHEGCP